MPKITVFMVIVIPWFSYSPLYRRCSTDAVNTLYLSTRRDKQHGTNDCRELSGFLSPTHPTHTAHSTLSVLSASVSLNILAQYFFETSGNAINTPIPAHFHQLFQHHQPLNLANILAQYLLKVCGNAIYIPIHPFPSGYSDPYSNSGLFSNITCSHSYPNLNTHFNCVLTLYHQHPTFNLLS